MIAYNRLYEIANENYGLVTTKAAEALGVSNMALVMLAKRGRLLRVGRGVYRLDQFPQSEYDPYAITVAKAGEGAFLWGPSVIALDQLCPTDPKTIYVATPKRIRRVLGKGVIVKTGVKNSHVAYPHGIPAQSLPDAILSSKGLIMNERLRDAANNAKSLGLILTPDYENLIRELT